MVNTNFLFSFALLASSIFAAPFEALEARAKGKAPAAAPKANQIGHLLNVVKSRLDNTLDVSKIKDQIKDVPKTEGQPCYPHIYGDSTNFHGKSLLDPHCKDKDMLEYPVYKDGKYDYETNNPKKVQRAGPFRALFTKDEGYYCGTISHDGTLKNKKKGTETNDSTGNFHVCSYDNTKEEYEKRVSEAKDEGAGKKGGKKDDSSTAGKKGKGGK